MQHIFGQPKELPNHREPGDELKTPICERLGIPVKGVQGSERAMKVTEAADFGRAEAVQTARLIADVLDAPTDDAAWLTVTKGATDAEGAAVGDLLLPVHQVGDAGDAAVGVVEGAAVDAHAVVVLACLQHVDDGQRLFVERDVHIHGDGRLQPDQR